MRSSSRLEILILSHHPRLACECNKEEIDDDDDDDDGVRSGLAHVETGGLLCGDGLYTLNPLSGLAA